MHGDAAGHRRGAGRFLGPLAQPLIGRELERCHRMTDFVDALAAGIDAPPQREAFLAALQRALPDRPI